MSNLTQLPGTGDEFKAAIEQMIRQKGSLIELGPVLAEIRYAHYKAYLTAGFSDTEALELCKTMT